MAHVVVFAGEYDLANKEILRRTLRCLESSSDLVLDLTEVTFVDSTFISELILLEKARGAKAFHRATIVVPKQSAIRRLFEIVGMASIANLVESYADEGVAVSDLTVEFAPNGNDLDATARAIHWLA